MGYKKVHVMYTFIGSVLGGQTCLWVIISLSNNNDMVLNILVAFFLVKFKKCLRRKRYFDVLGNIKWKFE